MKAWMLLVGLSVVFFTSSGFAEDRVRGEYEALNGVPPKGTMKIVLFEEFMNFGCPHCNNLFQASQEFREKYKNRVNFVDYPILFQGQDDAPLRLFYAAKCVGKGDEKRVKKALFDAKFKHNVNVFDPGIVNYLAKTLGLDEVYRKHSRSECVAAQILKGDQKFKEYKGRGTPTVVIAGSLKMQQGHSMKKFIESLSNTLDDLLEK